MTFILLAAASIAAPTADAGPALAVARLSARPMAAPKPAMRYQLLPEVRELKPGNPVQWYVRCFAEQRNFFFHKDSVAERTRYQTMPLKDLPADKLKNYGGSALTQADWGARLDTPDWQVLASALQVRFRGEIARRDFGSAIHSVKTMLALARHLGECPTSAANRLGITVARLALDTLEEMVQQPGCPNLYWALTDLPGPLVDLRKGFQGDRAVVDAELRLYRDDAALTAEEVEELVSRLSGRSGFAREQAGLPPRNLRAALAGRAKDADAVRAARARLIGAGLPKDRAVIFPALQVVLLDEKREYELGRDERLKLLGLAPWQVDAVADQKGADGLFAELLPRVVEARRAQGRLEQRVAILRHVEALRMYAAAHDGKLPATLEEVGVPLPLDPFTGKPFRYELKDGVAHLRGNAPKGEENNPAFNVRYEITLK